MEVGVGLNPPKTSIGDKGTKVKAKAPQTEKATAGEVAMPNWVIFKEAQTSRPILGETTEGGRFRVPMTDPWDERYIYGSMNSVDFYGKFVGKYDDQSHGWYGFWKLLISLRCGGVVLVLLILEIKFLFLKGVLVEGCIWNMKIDDICGIYILCMEYRLNRLYTYIYTSCTRRNIIFQNKHEQ